MMETGAAPACAEHLPACSQILLVERNASLRESASAWLRANDYSVREVASQSDAIIQLASTHYDLVVADISLASAEELTLLVWLGSKHPRIPVIGTLREEPTPETRECALELGMRLLLVKPYRLAALLDAVRCALTAGPSRRGFSPG